MPTEGWKASNMYVLVYVLFVNHRYVLKDIETISGLGWFLAWSIGLKLRKVSRKNAITLGNSWILQNSIWERKGKVFLIQIHDLSFRHFFTKRRDKIALESIWRHIPMPGVLVSVKGLFINDIIINHSLKTEARFFFFNILPSSRISVVTPIEF